MATTLNELRCTRAYEAAKAAHAALDDISAIVSLPNGRIANDDDAQESLQELFSQSHALIDSLCNGDVPDLYPFGNSDLFSMPDVRESLMQSYMKTILNQFGMWAIVDKAWTKKLAEFIEGRQVLEVMAGEGWLAHALRGHGVQVKATDNASWREGHPLAQGDGTITDVETLDACEAVLAYPHAEVLVVSWPAYKDRTIVEVCDEWGCDRPIIYIGESHGGCTACAEFFENFEGQCLDVNMPRHIGLHDRVYLGYWQRTKSN